MMPPFAEFYSLINRHFDAYHLLTHKLPRPPYAILVQMDAHGATNNVAILVPKE